MITLSSIIILIFFGFFVGVIGSVMGVGGGVFIVPLLVLSFHLPMQNAIAISLISIIATSSAVASVNVEKGLANVRLGIYLEMAMAIGSIFGALLTSILPGKLLQFLFSIFLFPVAISMYLKAKKVKKEENIQHTIEKNIFGGSFFDPNKNSHMTYSAKRIPLATFFSFFAGGLSGLLGLGGGIVQVPVMNLICGVPIKAAAATSNFMIGVSAAASSIIFFKKGYIVPLLTVPLVFGVLIGSFIGINTLYRAKSEKIQMFFSILIMIVGIRMLIKSF